MRKILLTLALLSGAALAQQAAPLAVSLDPLPYGTVQLGWGQYMIPNVNGMNVLLYSAAPLTLAQPGQTYTPKTILSLNPLPPGAVRMNDTQYMLADVMPGVMALVISDKPLNFARTQLALSSPITTPPVAAAPVPPAVTPEVPAPAAVTAIATQPNVAVLPAIIPPAVTPLPAAPAVTLPAPPAPTPVEPAVPATPATRASGPTPPLNLTATLPPSNLLLPQTATPSPFMTAQAPLVAAPKPTPAPPAVATITPPIAPVPVLLPPAAVTPPAPTPVTTLLAPTASVPAPAALTTEVKDPQRLPRLPGLPDDLTGSINAKEEGGQVLITYSLTNLGQQTYTLKPTDLHLSQQERGLRARLDRRNGNLTPGTLTPQKGEIGTITVSRLTNAPITLTWSIRQGEATYVLKYTVNADIALKDK